MTDKQLSIGELREALVHFMDLGGVAGKNLHESRKVLLHAGGKYWPLTRTGVTAYEGMFVLVLTSGDGDG